MKHFSSKTNHHQGAPAQKQPESFFQAKLNVGQPGDRFELEADHVADKVVKGMDVHSPTPTPDTSVQAQQEEEIQSDKAPEQEIQPKPMAESVTPVVQAQAEQEQLQEKEEEEELQVQEEGEFQKSPEASDDEEDSPKGNIQAKSNQPPKTASPLEDQLHSSGGGGPMDTSTRSRMESGFGADFSGVKIHTDSHAVQMSRDLGAQAFTHGVDIYFNEGKYRPDTSSGQHLLAHELTHTIQQGKSKAIQRKENPATDSIDQAVTKGLAEEKVADDTEKDRGRVDRGKGEMTDQRAGMETDKGPEKPDTESSAHQGSINAASLDGTNMAPVDQTPGPTQTKKAAESAQKEAEKAIQKPDKQVQKDAPKKPQKKGGGGMAKSLAGKAQARSRKAASAALLVDTGMPRISATRSMGAMALLTKINTSYLQFQQRFLDNYAQKKVDLSALLASKQQELVSTGADMEARIIGTISNARQSIIQHIATSQGQISAHRAGQEGVLTNSETTAASTVSNTFLTGQTSITDEANLLANRAIQTANNAADQLRTNVTRSVTEAHDIGEQKAAVNDADDGVRAAKRRTAREIAADSAEKIAGGRSDAEQKIQGTGPMASEEFQKQGSEAAAQLTLGKGQVDGELLNIFSNAKTGIQSMESSSIQSLQQIQTQILDQLADLEVKLLRQLRQEIDKKVADLDNAGQQTLGIFDEQAKNALSKSRSQLEVNNNQIAKANISENKVGEAHSLAEGEMGAGFVSLQLTFENSALEVTNRLTQQNAEIKGRLGNTESAILSQIDNFSATAKTQIDQSKGSSTDQLSDAANQAVTGSSQIVAQVDTNITQQVQTINDNFNSGFVDFEGNLGTQVNEATEEASAPLGDLNSRIDEGQERAAVRAERSWLSNQFHDAVEMLSSPGFWAGLVVGLLLTIVFVLLIAGTALTGGALLAVLVVGFAVIGGVAAAVGSVVNQATNGSFSGGWDWSRVNWGEVGRAALFGAAAGAAFAVVAFFAVEVFGVAVASWTFVGIMSVTAGVVTVVTNLINGQPWDKDLLINMTIAGFFAWLARFFPGGRGRPSEEAPTDPPDSIPGRPGETETPVPIRPGQKIIVDDPGRLSYTTPVPDGPYYKWNLIDTETGAQFTHYVKATADTGPDMFLAPREAFIEGVGRVELVAEGFKWTTEANRLNMQAYEEVFGQRPPNLNGQIWASNLDRFVINYDQIRAQNPGMSRQAIADAAVRETSFGRGKIEQGYGNLRVKLDGVQFEDVSINGQTYRDVPSNHYAIDVIAEPTSP